MMSTKVGSVVLLAGMINSVFSIVNSPRERATLISNWTEVNERRKSSFLGLNKIMESDYAIYGKMEKLTECVVRVNRVLRAKHYGVFFQRNFTTQELLVSNYLKRIDHVVDVYHYGTGRKTFFRDFTIHNIVVFLHDLYNFHDIAEILGQMRINRKGKFVICIDSITWTKDILVVISEFLWKWKVANAILIVSDPSGKIQIYSYRPMEQKKCIPSKVIAIYDDCHSHNLKASSLFERKMRNMNLCPIIASVVNIAGAVHVYMANGTRKVEGFEGTIFNTIATKMNFTGTITPIPSTLWGEELPNGTWNGVHGNIMNGIADIAFGLMFPVAKRLNFEEYSYPIMTDRYVWILPRALPTNWNKLLLPFQTNLWIVTLVTLVTGLCVMYLTARGRAAKHKVLPHFLALTVGQSIASIRGRAVTKFFIISWIFFSIVLNNAYQSGLVGFLTTTKNVKNYESVEELIENDVPFGGAKTPSEVYNNPNNPEDYRIYKHYQFVPLARYLKFFFGILNGQINAATLVPASGVNYYRNIENWHMMKDIALHYPVPFIFPKGSPYIDEFNIQITRLLEGGFMDHWFYNNTTSFQQPPVHSHAPLKFVHVASIFGLWLIGISISTLIFLAEILCNGTHRITKRINRKTRNPMSTNRKKKKKKETHPISDRSNNRTVTATRTSAEIRSSQSPT